MNAFMSSGRCVVDFTDVIYYYTSKAQD